MYIDFIINFHMRWFLQPFFVILVFFFWFYVSSNLILWAIIKKHIETQGVNILTSLWISGNMGYIIKSLVNFFLYRQNRIYKTLKEMTQLSIYKTLYTCAVWYTYIYSKYLVGTNIIQDVKWIKIYSICFIVLLIKYIFWTNVHFCYFTRHCPNIFFSKEKQMRFFHI